MEDNTAIPSSAEVGLKDRTRSGWFNTASRELLPGVPIAPGMAVVDVGCGFGPYTSFCAQVGADVTFLDMQESQVTALQSRLSNIARGAVTGLTSDCNPIPLADECADLVICTEVMEHVEDPDKLMGELNRIARPGATCLLSVPDSRSEKLMEHVAHRSYFQKPNHIRVFSAESFQRLVVGEGLQIQRHDTIGAFWSLFFLFKWATTLPGENLMADVHPITKTWTSLWADILDHPNGDKMVAALNDAVPKSQFIVAHKRGPIPS